MKNYFKIFLVSFVGIGFCTGLFSQSSSTHDGLSTAKLMGGMAQANITPPIGSRLAGHFFESISTGIHDSLWAKAMVLQQGKEKFVFVFCDLIGMTPQVSSTARLMAFKKTGIPVRNIVIAATHSHTGPLFYGFQHDYFHTKAMAAGIDPHEKIDYSGFLIKQIVKAIVGANNHRVPVSLETGIGEQERLSHNRRYYMKNGEVLFNPGPLNPEIVRPAGPIDPAVGILMIRNVKSWKLLGGLTVFAMHADSFGGTQISADYPFYIEQTLKQEFGTNFISAFGLGPCGDINHIDVTKDEPIYSPANPRRFGTMLGQTVIDAVPNLKQVINPRMAILSAKILLPLEVPAESQIDSARTIINKLYEAGDSGEYTKRAGGESGDFIKRVRMSKYINLAARKKNVEVEVQVYRLDSETAMVALPGEIFAALGLAIKKSSPFKNTLVITVCNDKTSYVPTRKAFTEGSYEVTNAVIKPGAGEMLVETSVKLLNKIKRVR
ncbi:MAG: hypothetical protein JWP81_3990 [Ferruginibacter sp.]|nr:hypothetical protein [Ferruginibacter sp.]